MAQRTSITKMKLTKENIKQEKNFSYNDETVVVKQYLPINDKLGMIQDIMTYAMAESNNNFMNPVKIEVFSMLFFTEYYTNIKFTENYVFLKDDEHLEENIKIKKEQLKLINFKIAKLDSDNNIIEIYNKITSIDVDFQIVVITGKNGS